MWLWLKSTLSVPTLLSCGVQSGTQHLKFLQHYHRGPWEGSTRYRRGPWEGSTRYRRVHWEGNTRFCSICIQRMPSGTGEGERAVARPGATPARPCGAQADAPAALTQKSAKPQTRDALPHSTPAAQTHPGNTVCPQGHRYRELFPIIVKQFTFIH